MAHWCASSGADRILRLNVGLALSLAAGLITGVVSLLNDGPRPVESLA